MEFLNSHIDAILTLLIASISFLGVMYKHFSIIDRRLTKLETLAKIFLSLE